MDGRIWIVLALYFTLTCLQALRNGACPVQVFHFCMTVILVYDHPN